MNNIDYVKNDDEFNQSHSTSKSTYYTTSFETYNVKYLLQNNNFIFKMIDSSGYGSQLNIKYWLADINNFVKKRVNVK